MCFSGVKRVENLISCSTPSSFQIFILKKEVHLAAQAAKIDLKHCPGSEEEHGRTHWRRSPCFEQSRVAAKFQVC